MTEEEKDLGVPGYRQADQLYHDITLSAGVDD